MLCLLYLLSSTKSSFHSTLKYLFSGNFTTIARERIELKTFGNRREILNAKRVKDRGELEVKMRVPKNLGAVCWFGI